jgi:hypothetical protein
MAALVMVAGGVLYEHSGHFALLYLAISIIAIDIMLRFLMEDEFDEVGSTKSLLNETAPFLPEPSSVGQEILPKKSVLITLLRNGDLLASLWVGFMSAIIRTALEMVRLPMKFDAK